MTDNEIIKALESEIHLVEYVDGFSANNVSLERLKNALDLINCQKAEIEKLQAFKSYFDELYGKGLEVANWHLNGNAEPFDNFYESALEEMKELDNG